MNHAIFSLAKTEIIKELGCFPAFIAPAIKSSLIYQSLVQQTLFAYINNPLPAQFKEKLFVVLSRYFGISYFTICHSCTLRSLGISATEILALEKLQYPQSELEVAADLELLSQQWPRGGEWQHDSELEISLLRCSSLIFLHPQETVNLSVELQELLGTVYYHYLIVFLGYIKLCHQWIRSNQYIEHQQDRRSQLHLGPLLLENIELAQFLTAKVKPTTSLTANLPAVRQNNLVKANINHSTQVLLPKFKQKIITAIAEETFPVMIHNRQGEIIHLNRNWLEATGYDAQEISTMQEWHQKAHLRKREIVKLPVNDCQPDHRDHQYADSTRQMAVEATTTLQKIINSLIEIAPAVTQTKIRTQTQLTDAIRSEVKVVAKNGAQLDWEVYSTALSFESEANELVISIAKDITDLVDHEARLVELEAKLRLVLEATKTGNWSWDLTTNQVDVCHQGRTILGLENFDGSYESFLQSINPEERESVDLEIAKAIQAHQDLNIKYSVVKSNQEVLQIHTKGKLHYSPKGKAVRLNGVVIDITATKQQNNRLSSAIGSTLGCDLPESDLLIMQENTAQSLSELRTIIDLLPYFLFVVNVNTNSISLMNSGLAISLNLAKEEVNGKAIAECFSWDYAQQINWQHQQVTTYKQVLRIQEEVTLPDGIHYFDTVVTPLYDSEGNIYALLRTSSDIPDLAATQEALSQRTIQLEAANRELESFSYSVSHDLQAPLRIINGFSQVLWDNYLPNLDDRGKHYLQRIQANSKRMSDLIDALLELSRVTRSQMKPVQVNLSAIAQDIIEELQGEDSERQVEVKLAPDLETKGDSQLLRIVLSNLLHNAWKYTSKRSHPRIEFGIIADNISQPIYFIQDNGAGFDQNYVDKLFTAFQRLHTQAEFPGTGIGLATVQRIIYRHGGKVWAEGECDRGATIYFSL